MDELLKNQHHRRTEERDQQSKKKVIEYEWKTSGFRKGFLTNSKFHKVEMHNISGLINL